MSLSKPNGDIPHQVKNSDHRHDLPVQLPPHSRLFFFRPCHFRFSREPGLGIFDDVDMLGHGCFLLRHSCLLIQKLKERRRSDTSLTQPPSFQNSLTYYIHHTLTHTRGSTTRSQSPPAINSTPFQSKPRPVSGIRLEYKIGCTSSSQLRRLESWLGHACQCLEMRRWKWSRRDPGKWLWGILFFGAGELPGYEVARDDSEVFQLLAAFASSSFFRRSQPGCRSGISGLLRCQLFGE